MKKKELKNYTEEKWRDKEKEYNYPLEQFRADNNGEFELRLIESETGMYLDRIFKKGLKPNQDLKTELVCGNVERNIVIGEEHGMPRCFKCYYLMETAGKHYICVMCGLKIERESWDNIFQKR